MTQPTGRKSPGLEAALTEFLTSEGAPEAASSGLQRAGVPQARSVPLDDAFAEVLEHEAAKARLAPEASRSGWPASRGLLLLLGLTAASGYIWLGQPTWLYPPPPDPVPVTSEQGVEQSLITAGLALNAWRMEHEGLPGTLDELGLGLTGVRYQALPDGGFQLVAGLNGQQWTLLEAAPGAEPEITVVPDQETTRP